MKKIIFAIAIIFAAISFSSCTKEELNNNVGNENTETELIPHFYVEGTYSVWLCDENFCENGIFLENMLLIEEIGNNKVKFSGLFNTEGTIIDYNKIKIENCDVVYTDYYYDNDLNEEITITTNRFAYFNYLEIIDNFNMNFSFLYFDEEQNKYITQYCHIIMMWYPTN